MTIDGLPTADRRPLLSASSVNAGYGKTQVLFNVDFEVPPGAVVALIGPNGVGKTTFLRILSGLLRPISGSVTLDGDDVTADSPHRRARRGICLIPEGRGIFRSLTVKDNLELQRPPWVGPEALEVAVDAFPVLGERLHQIAGSLSGGQQQMLALARAMMAKPKVVLLDEVSMGLAPIVVDQIFEHLNQLARSDVAMVLVEQYVNRAIAMADRVCLMSKGQIAWSGPAAEVDLEEVTASYLGETRDEQEGGSTSRLSTSGG